MKEKRGQREQDGITQGEMENNPYNIFYCTVHGEREREKKREKMKSTNVERNQNISLWRETGQTKSGVEH